VSERACDACGRAFGCGADESSCWCSGVELDDAARAGLAAAYDGCLCPACLGAAAGRPLDLVEPPAEAAGALDVRTQRPHPPGQLGV
jgi:hypothetical protein